MSSQSYIYNPTERTLAAAGDGFSCPRLTTAGRTSLALTANDKGMMVYDTTLTTLCIWNGAAWEFITDNSNGFISVKDYGAKGDGVTNDTAAIQAAIDSGYKTIWFPDGEYLFTPPLLVNQNGLTLWGAGPLSGPALKGSKLVPTATASSAIKVASTGNVSILEFRSLELSGNATCTDGIEFGNVAGNFYANAINIYNCYIHGFTAIGSSGLKINNAWWFNIYGNSLIDSCYYGIHIPSNCVALTTLELSENTKIESCSRYGIYSVATAVGVVDKVILNGMSIEYSGYAAVYSRSPKTIWDIRNCYFEVNGQNPAASGTIDIDSSSAGAFEYASAHISNNAFHVTTNGKDIKFGYVLRSTVENNNGFITCTTAGNSQVYFTNNRATTAVDWMTLYKSLLGQITAWDYDSSTGYWVYYSSTGLYLQDSHIITSQAVAPTIAFNPPQGVNATVTLSSGSTDTSGQIIVTTTGATFLSPLCILTFNKAFTKAPFVVITPASNDAAIATNGISVDSTTTKVTLNCNTAVVASGISLRYNYHVISPI